jgi:hypothetical protein
MVCYVEIERIESSLVVTNLSAVKPSLTVFLYAVELDKNLTARQLFTDYKVLSVPSPPIPPIFVIPLRGVANKGMNFPCCFVGAPGMWDSNFGPCGIVEFRILATGIRILCWKVVERPVSVDGFAYAIGTSLPVSKLLLIFRGEIRFVQRLYIFSYKTQQPKK